MNKLTKDYCNKKYHPKSWRAWVAKYQGLGPMDNKYTHSECAFCGGKVDGGGTGSGPSPSFGFGFLKLPGTVSRKSIADMIAGETKLEARRNRVVRAYWLALHSRLAA